MAAAEDAGPRLRDVDSLAGRSNQLSAMENEGGLVPPVKRSIVLRKIKPQTSLTAAPRRSPRISPRAMKENVCESSPGSGGGNPCTTGQVSLPMSVTPAAKHSSPLPDTPYPTDRDSVMSQKVRRSYSRVSPFGTQAANSSDGSDTSTPNEWHVTRRSFFGFERLLATETLPAISPVKPASPKGKLPAPTAVASSVSPGAIPGVAAAKEKRKKRKVVQIKKSVLDEWAAQMNASFEEAERFDLLVE